MKYTETKTPRGKRSFVRTCISLNETLKKQMSKHPEVNWSGVAANAFVRKLEELQAESRRKS